MIICQVRAARRVSLWKVAPSDAERLPKLAVDDWVKLWTRPSYEWNSIRKDSITVVKSIHARIFKVFISHFVNL